MIDFVLNKISVQQQRWMPIVIPTTAWKKWKQNKTYFALFLIKI